MPKCPECKKEIDTLINMRSGAVNQRCFIIDNSLDYGSFDFEEDGVAQEWVCPECDKCLFVEETDVIKFFCEENGN